MCLQRSLVAGQRHVDEGLSLEELMEHGRHVRLVVVPAQAVVLPGHPSAARRKKNHGDYSLLLSLYAHSTIPFLPLLRGTAALGYIGVSVSRMTAWVTSRGL